MADLNHSRSDRSPLWWRLLACLALIGCAHTSPTTAPALETPPAALPLLWVDASAPTPGDGSVQRPFKALTGALTSAAEVHLRSGLYPGPFTLPDGARLVGHGAVVLLAEGEATVVTATRGGLEELQVQGGAIGLSVSGEVHLASVGFSGQRKTSVLVAEHGALTAERLSMEGTLDGTEGLRIVAGGRATLLGARATGAYRKALVSEGELAVKGFDSLGPATGVHLLGGEARLDGVTIEGGRGPGVYAAHAKVRLDHLSVKGHEYGLLTQQAQLEGSDLRLERTQRAGVALVGGEATLEGLTIATPGDLAGIQILEGTATLTGVNIQGARGTAILARQARVALFQAHIDGVSTDGSGGSATNGDAIEVRGGSLQGEHFALTDSAGVGLLATAEAQVHAVDVTCTRSGLACLLAERHSSLSVRHVDARSPGQAAFAVPDDASLELREATVSPDTAPWFYAECSAGARVSLTLSSGQRAPERLSPCVHVTAPAAPPR